MFRIASSPPRDQHQPIKGEVTSLTTFRQIFTAVTTALLFVLATALLPSSASAFPAMDLRAAATPVNPLPVGWVPTSTILDWVWCDNSTGNYIYLETDASTCGSGGEPQFWSWSFAGSGTVEVCHSAYHSGTTTMWYRVGSTWTSLSDSAGGGCAKRLNVNAVEFWVSWGSLVSPNVPNNLGEWRPCSPGCL